MTQPTGEYHLAQLPPIDDSDREWRYIASDGRLVRVIDVTGIQPRRKPRPVYARLPGHCDRCHRAETPECGLDLEQTSRGSICRFCRTLHRAQVHYVFYERISDHSPIV